jgi:hypothetical protein
MVLVDTYPIGCYPLIVQQYAGASLCLWHVREQLEFAITRAVGGTKFLIGISLADKGYEWDPLA